MPQTFEGLTSFTSMDEALTELWKAQDRVLELERELAHLKANLAIARNNAEVVLTTGEETSP